MTCCMARCVCGGVWCVGGESAAAETAKRMPRARVFALSGRTAAPGEPGAFARLLATETAGCEFGLPTIDGRRDGRVVWRFQGRAFDAKQMRSRPKNADLSSPPTHLQGFVVSRPRRGGPGLVVAPSRPPLTPAPPRPGTVAASRPRRGGPPRARAPPEPGRRAGRRVERGGGCASDHRRRPAAASLCWRSGGGRAARCPAARPDPPPPSRLHPAPPPPHRRPALHLQPVRRDDARPRQPGRLAAGHRVCSVRRVRRDSQAARPAGLDSRDVRARVSVERGAGAAGGEGEGRVRGRRGRRGAERGKEG